MCARRRVFDHERLDVYQKALQFVLLADRLAVAFTGVRRHLGWQLHRAATSILLNIAEGSGRYRPADKAQFFVVAIGSAAECAAVLDIAEALDVGDVALRHSMRASLESLIPMLTRLSSSVRSRP